MAEGKRATELDPLSPQVLLDTTWALAWQGKYQAAIEQANRARDIDPAFFGPPFQIGWIDIQAGKFSDAIPELQKARRDGFSPVGCRVASGTPMERQATALRRAQ